MHATDSPRCQARLQQLGGSNGFRRHCQHLAAQGLTKTQAAARLGVPQATFWRWLDEHAPEVGWACYERTPEHVQRHAERLRNRPDTSTLVDVGDGHGPSSLRQLSLRYGIAYSVIHGRHQRGWEPARLVVPPKPQR
jgi:hypothetical protein